MSIATELIVIFTCLFTALIVIGLTAQISDYLNRIAVALEHIRNDRRKG